jgi:hypothetical protein
VTTQKTSAFVYSSGSSVQIASSVSSQVDATIVGTGQTSAFSQGHGASTVTVNGVTLEATFRQERGGLSVVLQGFDQADPGDTRLHEELQLKPGERRVIAVQRAHGRPPVSFTITHTGGGLQISADGD